MNSSKPRHFHHWFEDILNWGIRLESYIAGMDETAFSKDIKTQDAVIRCIECIGEAATQIILHKTELPANWFTQDFEEARWTRNRLIHGYFDISTVRVWQTATISIPRLLAFVRSLPENSLDD
jgi:uncharacterized protein with HEPN domain